MPQNWGNFFDQAPTTEAGLPVAAMRAAVRPGNVFPQQGVTRPTSLIQPNIVPPMPSQPMRMSDMGEQKQTNEYSDMAKQVAGAVGGGEQEQKPDAFGNAMASIDQQLAQMKADREAMVAAINKEQQTGVPQPGNSGTLQNGYKVPVEGGGPSSEAKGNEGFNFNVGNLRASGMNWAGKGTPYNGFETFDSAKSGAMAMYNNLKSYAGDPSMTLGKAIMKWAPPSENNTNAYIANVSKMAGMDPNTPLSQIVANPEMAAKMMAAMARIEKGSSLHPAFTHELFVSAAGGDTGEKGSNKEAKYARGGRVRYLRSLVGG